MVEINLLAWRAEKELYEKKQVRQFLCAGMLAAFMLISGLHFYLSHLINQESQRVASLRLQIPDDSPNDVSSSVKADEQIFLPLNEIINILAAAAKSARAGVCYQHIARKDSLLLVGNALTIAAVTASLGKLQESAVFGKVRLREIRSQPEDDMLRFTVDAGGG